MLGKGEIPLQAGLKTLNPRLTGLDSDVLVIPKENTPWKRSHVGQRRAMLNNFGAAGSNTALLLEELEAVSKPQDGQLARSSYVFNLSAKTPEALQESILQYQRYLDSITEEVPLKDICYTATARRQIYETRISIACSSVQDLREGIKSIDVSELNQPDHHKTLVFVFSGQGASHRGMGRELLETSSVFTEMVNKCDAILRRFDIPSVLSYIESEETSSNSRSADDTVLTQCACVTLEYSLAKMMTSWGVIPSYMIGHRYVTFYNLSKSSKCIAPNMLSRYVSKL